MAILPATVSHISWRPGIGDPDFIGWFTFVSYLVAAFLCAWAARRASGAASRAADRRNRVFWYGLAVLMLLLGINKQLDLQTLMTEVGRGIAKAEGWYERRQRVQAVFIAALVAFSSIALLILGVLMRRRPLRHWVALVGVALLVCYVVIRAASFHHVDRVLGMRVAGVKVHWAIELAGIATIGVSAALDARRSRRSGPSTAPRAP